MKIENIIKFGCYVGAVTCIVGGLTYITVACIEHHKHNSGDNSKTWKELAEQTNSTNMDLVKQNMNLTAENMELKAKNAKLKKQAAEFKEPKDMN